MRLLLACLLCLLVPSAGAQFLDGAAMATFGDVPTEVDGDGSVAIEIPVHLRLEGLVCGEETEFTVALAAQSDPENASVRLVPEAAVFTVPAGTTLLTAYEQTRVVTLVIEPPAPNSTVQVSLQAAEPQGMCTASGGIARSGDQSATSVTWQAEPEPEPEPEQIMPVPGVAIGLLAIMLARLGSRDNGPK